MEVMNKGYIRVAGVSPIVNVADCNGNVQSIISECVKLSQKDVKIALFPELSITGYTCGDLFLSETLLSGAEQALMALVEASKDWNMLLLVGMPLRYGNKLYNCAVAIERGKILAVIPKSFLGNPQEKRWWTSGVNQNSTIEINNQIVPFGTDIIFNIDGVLVGVEIGDDINAPIAPSVYSAIAGAQIVLNLGALNDVITQYSQYKQLLATHSQKNGIAYIYAGAGYGESTTDMVFDGKVLVYENGTLLTESDRWSNGVKVEIADIDIDALNKIRFNSFAYFENTRAYRVLQSEVKNTSPKSCLVGRIIEKNPFIPNDIDKRNQVCEEAINIQVLGLMKRLQFTNTKSLVLGVSGGLDSTLALLVAVKAFDRLAIPRENIVAITMPGFGTTVRTKSNAYELMSRLGVTIREISIADAVIQHFNDIEHDINIQNITYENAQARERTQILMDIANQVNGMVLGTGDLSELALGWATYNGDHMSMYGINAGVPKTLIKEIVKWLAQIEFSSCADVLADIIETPISPELIPAEDNGEIKQKTEDNVGPYELHDFFLYYVLKMGYSPTKIYRLAQIAFKDDYNDETIKKWLRTFFRRFFAQQFKRSCLPDGPKVCEVSLSPRGDWSMPSDASAKMWLDECDKL